MAGTRPAMTSGEERECVTVTALQRVIDCPAAMGIIRAHPPQEPEPQAMQPFETIYVESQTVACNGGGGALGHPKVYLNLGPEGKIECPYCSRLFIHVSKRGEAPAARAS
jgi:uncharacterized Zn-finger protein